MNKNNAIPNFEYRAYGGQSWDTLNTMRIQILSEYFPLKVFPLSPPLLLVTLDWSQGPLYYGPLDATGLAATMTPELIHSVD